MKAEFVSKYGKTRMHRFLRWRERLHAATTEGATWRVLREYVSSLSPEAIAALPEECQNALIDPDVQSAAVVLLRAEMGHSGDPEKEQLLHEIAHTFAAAAVRMSRFSLGDTLPNA